MTMGHIGAILLVLAVLFLFSQVWFHLVEGLLGLLKRLLSTLKCSAVAWVRKGRGRKKGELQNRDL